MLELQIIFGCFCSFAHMAEPMQVEMEVTVVVKAPQFTSTRTATHIK